MRLKYTTLFYHFNKLTKEKIMALPIDGQFQGLSLTEEMPITQCLQQAAQYLETDQFQEIIHNLLETRDDLSEDIQDQLYDILAEAFLKTKQPEKVIDLLADRLPPYHGLIDVHTKVQSFSTF